jgi:hypothetical protein
VAWGGRIMVLGMFVDPGSENMQMAVLIVARRAIQKKPVTMRVTRPRFLRI